MRLRAVSGIILTLLLTNILTVAFNVPPIAADSSSMVKEAYGGNPLNLTDSQEGFNQNASAEENPRPCSIDEDKWNFNETNEWADFASVARARVGLRKRTETAEDYLQSIRDAISEKGAKWVAGETSVSGLTFEERMLLCGAKFGSIPEGPEKLNPPPGVIPFGTFDWRNVGGIDWMTSVKDQGGCGSCWAFGTLGSMEAVINIVENDSYIDMDLSEQFLVSCCDECGDCGGGYPSVTYDFIMNTGVPDESCFLYVASDVPCDPCSDWSDRAWFITDWIWVSNDPDSIKGALQTYGPLGVALHAPDDFLLYKSGIYEPVWSSPEWDKTFPFDQANHWVTLVGYNDTGEYWIVKNSWGSDWGEEGYGKIAYRVLEQYDYILAIISVEGPTPPEHDLRVSVQVPPYLEPSNDSLLNVTVLNRGLNNETNVELFLLINGTTVDNATIPELLTGSSYTLSYLWTPIVEGMYNVTAFAPPVPGENVTANNVDSVFVGVGFAVKAFVLDSAGTDISDVISTWEILNTNWFTYGSAIVDIDYTTLNIDVITYDDIAATEADVLIISCAYAWEFTDSEIDAITQYVHEGHGLIATARTFYYWVPNNNKLASLFGLNETISWDTTWTDLLHLQDPMHPLFVNVPNPYTFVDAQTAVPSDGQWDWNELVGGTYVALGHYEESAIVVYKGLVYISPWLEIIPPYYHHHLQLLYNAITWSTYQKPEHELVVSLEAPTRLEPSESTLLNATVSNFGLNNETNVELFLLINGTAVDSTTISELLTGASYTINYSWTPTFEATYNVTAYAPSVPDENVTANNIMSKIVYVRYVDVALISDHSELLAITGILDSMGIGYDIYNDNSMYLYTEDLDLLLSYQIVIFNNYDRQITSSEHSALQSYLSSGRKLLVSGYDSLGHPSDTLLADIVRSSSVGDNTGEPDLYVVDETHPIMNGPYGSFPAGYHILALYSDCDAVEADIARNAITVAELADGYDKIIATELSPGRVVYWNGKGTDDWIWNVDCEAMLKNTLAWFIPHEHELTVTLDAPTFLEPGESTLLNATVSNFGLNNETNVELFLLINGTAVDSTTISELLTGASYTLGYVWTPTVLGTYNITAYAPPVPDETFTGDNVATKMVRVLQIRDVAIISVTTSAIEVYEGQIVNITVVAKNEGIVTETFDVTVYYDASVFGIQTVTNLTAGANVTLTFSWDTTGVEPSLISYTIKAVATPVPGEIDTADNTYVDGSVKVKMLGDINGDGIIDIEDLTICALAMWSQPGDPKWNPILDLNNDGVIDITDLVMIAIHFGETC